MTLTLTEKNQHQYILRQKMHEYNLKAEACAQEIARLNLEYQSQFETPLFDEMFGG